MSMNNLAKELKKAGFPQELKNYPIWENVYWVNGELFLGAFKDTELTGDEVKQPTLSELIEACGEDRIDKKLKMHFSLTYWPANKLWYAEQRGHQGIGKTPEEAATRLFIALNKEK